ncbi:MAG: hypothetical protein K2X82_33585 [Gemmataceae bacterium]|nr:hypothetical protein [Gemmataceae bacterium]
MKRFGFALAAGFAALVAAPAAAQDVVVTTPTPAVPVVTAGPVVESGVVNTKTRRGLFGRLRSRSTAASTVSAPAVMTTPAPIVTPVAPAPAVVPAVPATMPAKPGTVSMRTTTTVMPAAGVVMPGEVMTVTPAGYVTASETTTVKTTRRGLFGRLRSR